MSILRDKYSGPTARPVGHKQYDKLISAVISKVQENASREDILTFFIGNLSGLSRATAMVVLNGELIGSNAEDLLIAPYIQKGIQENRWKEFINKNINQINRSNSPHLYSLLLGEQDIDLWGSEYVQDNFQEFSSLFDVRKAGWLNGIYLPRATARHPYRAILLWYPEKSKGEPPIGGEQDWRTLEFFRYCYNLASFQLRKEARTVIEQRKILLQSMAPSILNHEINNRLSNIMDGLNRVEGRLVKWQTETSNLVSNSVSISKDDLQKTIVRLKNSIMPQMRDIENITHSVLGLTKRSESEFVKVQVLLDQIKLVMAHGAGRQSASIEIDVKPESLTIESDTALLMHVIINLVNNSLDSFDKKPRNIIILRAGMTQNSENKTENKLPNLPFYIEVEDNGPGIPEEIRSRIFEQGVTYKKDGHGLGLTICKFIAGYLGGEITFSSVLNKGSIFRLSLPYKSLKETELEEEFLGGNL